MSGRGVQKRLSEHYSGDERVFAAHILDLIDNSRDGALRFSDFCDMRQCAIVGELAVSTGSEVSFWGGLPDSERKVAVFSVGVDHIDYPVSALLLKTWEPVGHRDVLGSVLALGVKREFIGDIVNTEDGQVIFLKPPSDRLVTDELTRIGRQAVSCLALSPDAQIVPIRNFKESSDTLASMRLDAVVAACCNISRAQAQELVCGGRVWVDAQSMTNSSYPVRPQGTVSVRGFGKYIYSWDGRMTAKGRYPVSIKKYL